jgi:hypothetical protein
MKDLDLIINLYRYFSQFLTKEVLEKMFRQQIGSRLPGYDEIETEVLNRNSIFSISGIDTFVLSVNEKFVSDSIKNAQEYILFVEYGKINVDHDVVLGTKENLSISVIHSFSSANNDNINEVLLMNECLKILDTIVGKMIKEQSSHEFCQNSKLIDSAVEYNVVDPVAFYGFGGWSAMFNNANTIIT